MSGRINRETLETAFDKMGAILAARNVMGEIAIYGGSAIMLQYEYRESTADVDCVVVAGHGAVIDAMLAVGREMALGSGWLNENVSIYASRMQTNADMIPYGQYPKRRRPHLIVSIAKPEYLLAMKIEAFRRAAPRDIDDAEMLSRGLGLKSADEMMDVHARYFGDNNIPLLIRQTVAGIAKRLGDGGGNDETDESS